MVTRHDNHRPAEPWTPHTNRHTTTLAHMTVIGSYACVADETAGTPSSREESGVSRSPSLRRAVVRVNMVVSVSGWWLVTELMLRTLGHGQLF